jgi:glycine cleavage system aminomethyltransferase T
MVRRMIYFVVCDSNAVLIRDNIVRRSSKRLDFVIVLSTSTISNLMNYHQNNKKYQESIKLPFMEF